MLENIKGVLLSNEAKAAYILLVGTILLFTFVWLSIITDGLVFLVAVALGFLGAFWYVILMHLEDGL